MRCLSIVFPDIGLSWPNHGIGDKIGDVSSLGRGPVARWDGLRGHRDFELHYFTTQTSACLTSTRHCVQL